MATLRENAETVLNQARIFKAVIAIAEVIGSVDKVEQLIGEANARLKAKQDEEALLDGRMADAAAKLKAAQDKVSKAKAKAAELAGDAQAAHDATVKQANEASAEILKDAKGKAGEIIAAANKSRMEAEELVRAKQAELTTINGRVDAGLIELAAITEQIETARATIKQMIGG